jgi:hypothetical protein
VKCLDDLAQLSKYSFVTCPPMRRYLAFTAGSPLVRLTYYRHDDGHAPPGWYARGERTLEF